MLALLSAYALPLAAALAVGVPTGALGGRGLAWAWSLAAALVFAAGAVVAVDAVGLPGRLGSWVESGLAIAAAYAVGFALAAALKAALTPARAGASPPPGPRTA